jgi:putative membrane protein
VAPGPAATTPSRLAWTAAAVGILGQIVYPLVGLAIQTRLTSITVVAFFLAMSLAVCSWAGWRRAALAVAVCCVVAWSVESVGVRTAVPFGRYAYTGSLRPILGPVPVIVPLAWTALALAALFVGRRLALAWRISRPVAVAILGGGALASWDLFLDPQMVAAGYWRWENPHWTIPGIAGIPISNFAGWLVVAVVLIAIVDRVLPNDGPEFGQSPPIGGSTAGRVAATVYLWTYASELLAGFAFFHRPWVALVGGIVMGVFAIPYARATRSAW